MKNKFLVLAAALALFFAPLLLASPAAAFNPFGSVCSQSNAASSPACQQNKGQNGSDTDPAVKIIHTAADIIASVAGVASVIIIIISGFMFVTAGGQRAGGDTNRIKTARSTLIGAIIGLIVIALAWTIVTFVTDRFIS